MAAIICRCPPHSLSGTKLSSFDPLLSPHSVPPALAQGTMLTLHAVDKRAVSDPKQWLTKFLEDGQNPAALANIVCHLSWRNLEYSRKVIRSITAFLEDYHSSVDCLQSLGHAALLLVSGRGDALQPQASDRALRHAGPLLEVLKHQPTAGGSDRLDPVGPGVVGQTTPVSNSLDHFSALL